VIDEGSGCSCFPVPKLGRCEGLRDGLDEGEDSGGTAERVTSVKLQEWEDARTRHVMQVVKY
jgi:hypothetical protein